MPYTRPYAGGFVNYPTTTTPIDATALNTMDVGIKTSNDQFQTVTTTQRTALSPTVGQAVWDSDLRQLMVFMNASGGNAWQPVGNTIVCASTTRPSVPFEGQEIYETDTNQRLIYNGSSWVEVGDLDNTNGVPSGLAPFFSAWTSFTPVLKGSSTNPTLGTGSSATGSYLKIGRLLIVTATITFGTSGVTNGAGIIFMDLPASLSLSTQSNASAVGSAALIDNSANRAYGMTVTGTAGTGAATQVGFRAFDSAGGSFFFYDNPITIAASDSFRVQIICETTT